MFVTHHCIRWLLATKLSLGVSFALNLKVDFFLFDKWMKPIQYFPGCTFVLLMGKIPKPRVAGRLPLKRDHGSFTDYCIIPRRISDNTWAMCEGHVRHYENLTQWRKFKFSIIFFRPLPDAARKPPGHVWCLAGDQGKPKNHAGGTS